MFKQVPLGEESLLETEMNQLRLIRYIKPVQIAQKGMTRQLFQTNSKDCSNWNFVFNSIIRLEHRNIKREFQMIDIADDKTPKGCPETGVLNIMEIKALLQKKQKKSIHG